MIALRIFLITSLKISERCFNSFKKTFSKIILEKSLKGMNGALSHSDFTVVTM